MPGSGTADLAAEFYDAAVGEGDWSAALCRIADSCEMENAALVHLDQGLGYSDVTAPRADPDVVGAYNAHWWQFDPTVKATAGAPVGTLTTLEDTGRDRFLASAFYNDFWMRSGLGADRIAVNLVLSERAFVSCVLQTAPGRDTIERSAYDRFAALTPHLIRAVTIQRSLRSLALENYILKSGRSGTETTVLMLDSGGRIVFADEAAEKLLAGDSALRTQDGTLGLADTRANEDLASAVARVGRTRVVGAPIDLPDPDGVGGMTIEVLPWGRELRSRFAIGRLPAVIVVVRRTAGRPVDDLRRPRPPFRPVEHGGAKKTADGRGGILDAIKADIRDHAGEQRLTLSWLGKRHGVSARRIRDFFYSENTNFTEFVMTVRLDRARDMLLDPENESANVAMIAAQAGFGDLSWFHHVFRRRFGVTPAEMRERGPAAG